MAKKAKDVLKKHKKKEKTFDNPFDARKYGDDIDRANFKENKSIEAKGMMCGGEARGTGAAIRGKGFKGVF